MRGLAAAFTSNETSPGMLGAHATSSFVKDMIAFTKSFVKNGKHSKNFIKDFVNKMKRDYNIDVTVKQ